MIKVVPKLMALLELFAPGDELGFSEITARAGLSRSCASHLLQALCAEEILVRTGYGKYRRGGRLTGLCAGGNPWQGLLERAGRAADSLVRGLDALAVVGMRDADRRLTVVKRRPARREFPDPPPADWYHTANGRVLLAFAPREVVEAVVRRHGPPARRAWREAVSLPKLVRELAVIREQGFVLMDAEGPVAKLGVPVRDASGDPCLSLAAAYAPDGRPAEAALEHVRYQASVLEEELRVGGIRVADLAAKGLFQPQP